MQTHIQTDKSFLKTYSFVGYDDLIQRCIDDIKDILIKNPQIIVYGKPATSHRSVGFFSNSTIGYHFSGKISRSNPLTPYLIQLINLINTLLNTDFNGILINRYLDGTDNIGAHSDDEKNLDKNGVVALSFGVTRKFRIRNKKTKKIIMDIPTISKEIIHMGGDFQKEFTHEIPIQKKIKGERYSFTFRKHI